MATPASSRVSSAFCQLGQVVDQTRWEQDLRAWSVFLRLLAIGRNEGRLITGFTVAALGIAVAQLFEPVLFGRVIDALGRDGPFSWYLISWVSLGLANACLSIFLAIASDRYAHRQRLKVMELAFARTLSMPSHEHTLPGSGRVVRTIQAGCDHVFNVTLSFFRDNLIALGVVLLLLPAAFLVEPKLALLLSGLAVLYVCANWLVLRRTHDRQALVEIKHQGLIAHLVDVMANVTVVRSFTRAMTELELFRDLTRATLRAQYPVLTWWGILNVITRLAAMAAMVALVGLGATFVSQGKVTAGEVVTMVGFSTLLIGRLDQCSGFFCRVVGQLATADHLFALIDHQGEVELPSGHSAPAPLARLSHGSAGVGGVRFEQVSFAYQINDARAVGVMDVSFAVEPGETVALVGPTGAGKSTCLALLQRLQQPDHGRILMGGIDIRAMDVIDLCRRIATVFQDPGLFNRSIYDNILVGHPTASRAEVEQAARLAHAHDFIRSRPGGYDFVVGERGLALSGGERQRLAIARALLKDAPILILDEATSALDYETEAQVQAAMAKVRAGKTTFLIAHRLSTVVAADRILVMEHGRLVQSGTFASLRSEPGLFADLLAAGEFQTRRLSDSADDLQLGAKAPHIHG